MAASPREQATRYRVARSPRPGPRRAVRLLVLGSLLAVVLVALSVLLPAAWVYFSGHGRIYNDPAEIPTMPVAIVFGAGLQADGTPSLMLADRVDAAVELYRTGKVRRLLMTGDNSSIGYNEVAAMKQRAADAGVPSTQINMDYAGFRTYDSTYRAKAIFGVDQAILVTQRYHLPRAIYLARAFGIEAVGLAAGRDYYPRQEYYDLREFAALVVSWYEVNITRPKPRYLGDPVDLERQNRE